jgi:GH18 family chitinase|tara:strand:+ start:1814 stop:2194 length:381 start_codon:yes stop_codon:yes gene_type:complete
MNHYAESNLLEIVEKILDLNAAMRFVAIIDLKGNILEAIMKEKKTSLETQKQQEKFCKDSAKARLMREYYDGSLGKTRYAHIERENVTQIYLYSQKSTIFVTMEPELSIDKKMSIITKIKKISSKL